VKWFFLGNVLLLAGLTVTAADDAFLGRHSCSSSGCHGGAGAQQNQSLVWSRLDPHARAAATLSSARSGRIAQVLKIPDATVSRDCTSCHAPLHGVPPDLFFRGHGSRDLNVREEAVSCESCHGPAQNWIRSHTRPDLTRAEKGLDGLRDLTRFYNRANACVACHQVLDPKLIAAGHPELLFELDGQSSAMPRHWKEDDKSHKIKGWIVGQTVALRELTAQLSGQVKTNAVDSGTFFQWQSALWVVSRAFPQSKVATIGTNLLNFRTNEVAGTKVESALEQLSSLHRVADAFALEMSVREQGAGEGFKLSNELSRTHQEFAPTEAHVLAAMRAERLVLALDRLSHTLGAPVLKELSPELAALFDLVQARPDFDDQKFSERLRRFNQLVSNVPP
jgi:Cytochrome c554 and c-prime